MKVTRSLALASVLTITALLVALLPGSPASAYHGYSDGTHWHQHSTAIVQVYMVDHTPAFWPVTTATYTWNNNTSNIGVYYNWNTCPNSDLHCVHVREYRNNDGSRGGNLCSGNGILGCAEGHRPPNSSGHVAGNHHGNASTVNVWLNRSTTSSSQARKVACHEIGHSIGLDHRGSDASCMKATIGSATSSTPSCHDYEQLEAIYAHRSSVDDC